MRRAWIVLAVVGCQGSNPLQEPATAQGQSAAPAGPESNVTPTVPGAGATRVEETASESKKPVLVECPGGATWKGQACVVDEVACPARSTKVDSICVGDVVCPLGSGWDGSACKRGASPVQTPCLLDAFSIPPSDVTVDGAPVGVTPRQGLPVAAGSHILVFTHAERQRAITLTCSAGKRSTAAVKF